MDAKQLYRSRNSPGLRGRLAAVISHLFIHVRPPLPFDEHSTETRVFETYLGRKGKVLLLGSNVPRDQLSRRGYESATQLDIEKHEHVDVVADAETMSSILTGESYDYIVSTSMLEHTHHPWLVFREAFELLRPGGILYIDAPWMYPLHGEPYDFFRFSISCLRNLSEEAGFEILESGSNVSGHGALYQFLLAYLSERCSFGRNMLYYVWQYVWTWLLFPLGLLERFGSRKKMSSSHTDSIVYVAARKPSRSA